MTGEQVAERKIMVARIEGEGLRQEVPAVQLLGAGCAVGTIPRNGFLGGVFRHQLHVEFVHGDGAYRLRHGDLQTAGEQGTSRV